MNMQSVGDALQRIAKGLDDEDPDICMKDGNASTSRGTNTYRKTRSSARQKDAKNKREKVSSFGEDE